MPSKKDEQTSALSELVREKQSIEAAIRQADKDISRIQKPNQ